MKGMLKQAVENHVRSFNSFVSTGLPMIVKNIPAAQVDSENKDEPSLVIKLFSLSLAKPEKPYKVSKGDDQLRPRECRVGHMTYGGKLTCKLLVSMPGVAGKAMCDADLGQVPVMVRSSRCNLARASPKELVREGEDETEAGGYFLIHGLERVIRMLIMPRCNYPMAISRPSYKSRGPLYTKYAVLMRCMREDGTTQTNTLHYTTDGGCYLRFSYSKEEWLIPLLVVLHAVFPSTDQMLGELLAGPRGEQKGGKYGSGIEGGHSDDIWTCVLVMLQQQSAKHPITGQNSALNYLGSTFRTVLGSAIPRRFTDEQVGSFIVERMVMVHTESPQQKQIALVVMFHKLMGLVTGAVDADSQDTMCNHDVLLPGNLFAAVLKENLEMWMGRLRAVIIKGMGGDEKGKKKFALADFVHDPKLLSRFTKIAGGVGRPMESFISTGNISSRSGLDLMQTSGYTVVADKLNHARFSSHFASVHRGQYFAEMKTTTVRKLLPETWGFLCPVHTPDGAPCGLLNHLASSARAVVDRPGKEITNYIVQSLVGLGMVSVEAFGKYSLLGRFNRTKHVWVMLDGKPLGFIEHSRTKNAELKLRESKVNGFTSPELEIVCVPKKDGRLFPGLFLFIGPGRLVRPVKCLRTGKTELIGPLEQLFLNISVLREERDKSHAMLDQGKPSMKAVLDAEGEEGEKKELAEQLPLRFSHEELEPTRMLSLLASLTPFSNHNQSPRNMYQCQMLKQTMGTPYHNHIFRMDNKVFRILNPQKPMVRTKTYDHVNADSHPTGTNAVVAVITYTGYDMEDAMLINKSSYERGFAHGVVYKTKIIEAGNSKRMSSDQARKCRFCNIVVGPGGHTRKSDALDDDGTPPIGTYLEKGTPMYCTVDHSGRAKVETYHDDEPAFVEQVHLIDADNADDKSVGQRMMLKLRYRRNPVVGDKFSSRHGQKGVMSLLWPQEDMPFTDGGVTPDILFNPHGFPSRMTIGMLIESIAGKAASCEGRRTADGTTFRGYCGQYDDQDDNNEDDPFLQQPEHAARAAGRGSGTQTVGGLLVADYFGNVLTKHGFQKLGTERMYSGIHGTELETEIFTGVIYYQRLRHLVMDKAQARSRGPNDRITQQPIKGRKRGGGIRFGEMERDSLIAHGTAYLLHDRLFRCSDFDTAYVCPTCGSILTPQANARAQSGWRDEEGNMPGEPWECPPCTRKSGSPVRCHPIPIPWVFRYLTCELAAMNVRINLRVSERGRQTSLSCPNPALGE